MDEVQQFSKESTLGVKIDHKVILDKEVNKRSSTNYNVVLRNVWQKVENEDMIVINVTNYDVAIKIKRRKKKH